MIGLRKNKLVPIRGKSKSLARMRFAALFAGFPCILVGSFVCLCLCDWLTQFICLWFCDTIETCFLSDRVQSLRIKYLKLTAEVLFHCGFPIFFLASHCEEHEFYLHVKQKFCFVTIKFSLECLYFIKKVCTYEFWEQMIWKRFDGPFCKLTTHCWTSTGNSPIKWKMFSIGVVCYGICTD